MNFVDNGTDLYVVNSLHPELFDEDLEKSLTRLGLVKVVVQVQGPHGTYESVRWKRPKFKSITYKNKLGEAVELKYKRVTPKVFCKTLAQCKLSQPKTRQWRVDLHSEKEYKKGKVKLFVTDKGDAFAVKPDGDIISVCANVNDHSRRGVGAGLLAAAFKEGGKKLDTYDGNFNFYQDCGMTPVSWCKGEEKEMPVDWHNLPEDERKVEDVIFFEKRNVNFHLYYDTADPKKSVDYFKSKVPKSGSYGAALKIRDNAMK